jgi:hypothetical protein
MTGPNLGAWAEAFDSVVDGFGLSTNKAINRGLHLNRPEGLPADFPPPLYALALALGAVAAGAQKAAEFANAVSPYADEGEVQNLLLITMAEHWARQLATPEPPETRQ